MLSMLCGMAWSEGATLRFATQEFAPFSYEKNGKAAGAMVEVMQAICAEANRVCSFQVLPWRRASNEVKNGNLDGLFVILPTPDREQWLFFSDPIVLTAYSFFVPSQSTWQFRSPADLTGMTLGVYGPSGTATSLMDVVGKNSSAQVKVILSNVRALRMLKAGRYGPHSAVLVNRDVGLALLKEHELSGLKPAGDLSNIQYSFGLSRKRLDAIQMQSLNAALQRLQKNGDIKSILDKYGLEPAIPR